MPTYYHGWIRKAEVEQLLKQVKFNYLSDNSFRDIN